MNKQNVNLRIKVLFWALVTDCVTKSKYQVLLMLPLIRIFGLEKLLKVFILMEY